MKSRHRDVHLLQSPCLFSRPRNEESLAPETRGARALQIRLTGALARIAGRLRQTGRTVTAGSRLTLRRLA